MNRTEIQAFPSAPRGRPAQPPVGKKSLKSALRAFTVCLFELSLYLSVIHDKNAVCVHHRVNAMGDGEHGAVLERLFDGALNQRIRLCIN